MHSPEAPAKRLDDEAQDTPSTDRERRPEVGIQRRRDVGQSIARGSLPQPEARGGRPPDPLSLDGAVSGREPASVLVEPEETLHELFVAQVGEIETPPHKGLSPTLEPEGRDREQRLPVRPPVRASARDGVAVLVVEIHDHGQLEVRPISQGLDRSCLVSLIGLLHLPSPLDLRSSVEGQWDEAGRALHGVSLTGAAFH